MALTFALVVDLQIRLVPVDLLSLALVAVITYAMCLFRRYSFELPSGAVAVHEIFPRRRRRQLHLGILLLLSWVGVYVGIQGPLTDQAIVRVISLVAIAGVLADITLNYPDPGLSCRWQATILSELTAVALILKGSVYFGTPGVPGLDTWFHLSVIQTLQNTGKIPGTIYAEFPLFHLGGAAIGIASGLDAKSSMFIIGAFSESLALVFGYLVARQFVDTKTSLLIAAVVGFSLWDVRWGFWIVAMTLGVLFFSAGVYVVVRLGNRRPSARSDISILLLFVVAINVTHPTVAFIFALTLSIFAAIGLVSRYGGSRRFAGSGATRTALVWIVMTAYWLYISGTLPTFVSFFQSSFVFDRILGGPSGSNQSGSFLLGVWDRMPFYLFGFLSVIGAFLAASTRTRRELGLLCMTGFVLIGISLYLDQTALTLGYGDRFAVFGEFLLAPALVLGAISLANFIRSSKGSRSVLVAILVVFIAVTLANYQTSTQPAFLHASDPPAQLSTPEMTSAQDVARLANGAVTTDSLTFAFLTWSVGQRTSYIRNPNGQIDGVIVLRTVLRPTTTWAETFDRLDACSCSTRFFDSGALAAYLVTK